MAEIYKLINAVQTYAWGSPVFIPELLSRPNPDAAPQAELWMGAHPSSPSKALSQRSEIALDQLIRRSPEEMLGERSAAAFGPRLPFLFKLLAAARPLSIQAHPNKEQAAEGWRKENAAGIPADAPNRNYRDDNHKPEIMCAITPFQALCGFRPAGEIGALLDAFGAPVLRDQREALRLETGGAAHRAFFVLLNSLAADKKRELAQYAIANEERLCREYSGDAPLWRLAAELSRLEGEDASVVAPLFLNYIELRPGEAIFLPAGVLHSYVGGFGVELMANSDNVLRGGLTKKHVDIDELLRVLRFEPFAPAVLKPESDTRNGLRQYRANASEFRLHEFDARAASKKSALPASVPSIAVVIEGAFEVRAENAGSIRLKRGESAFIPAAAAESTIGGSGLAYIASVPS